MRAVIIIPARFKSTRFPGKPLAKLKGKPMIQWVVELSARAVGIENVYVATDDIRIEQFVKAIGYQVLMTSETCLTGTDRIAEAALKIKADIYVNVQGDEPLISPKDIIKIINHKIDYPNDVINGYTEIRKNEDPKSRNIPKVIFTEEKYLVYMSRQVLPGSKKKVDSKIPYYKQVCIYAFSKEELLSFTNFGRKSYLEQLEDIEILRFLELNKKIRLVKSKADSLAVDIPEDIIKVEAALNDIWNET